MFGELTSAESDLFLKENIYGRIGCHAFGKTYIVPISYAYSDRKIYGRTFDGLKVSMMRNNPFVCFEVDVLDDMANWKSVIIQGYYKELQGTDRDQAIEMLLKRAPVHEVSETVKITRNWPFPDANPGDVSGIIFQIEVQEISGRYERADTHSK